MSTIAVLTVPPKQAVPLNPKELEQVLTGPISVGQSLEGLLFGSHRDQIEAAAGGNKINIRDLSGRPDVSQSKIPTVLHFFVRTSASKVTAYGVNFLITVPCVEPNGWILENILTSKISEKTGKTLTGGVAQLRMESKPKTWNIKLEPGENGIISIDFNASEEIGELPDEQQLRDELKVQFDAFLKFLDDLGL